MTTPLFSECLKKIATSLAAGDTKTSDAILLALRICRTMFPESRLKILNRELLGYLEEELLAFHKVAACPADPDTAEDGLVPTYRFVCGFWVPEHLTRQEMTVFSVGGSLTTKLFCNFGAREMELLMEKVGVRQDAFYALKLERESGRVFMCRSSELARVYSAMTERVCQMIDDLVGDLQMSPGS